MGLVRVFWLFQWFILRARLLCLHRRQHASFSARGHFRSAFGAFRPLLPASSTAGSRNLTRFGRPMPAHENVRNGLGSPFINPRLAGIIGFMQHIELFLSAVSDEFRTYRDSLRARLKRAMRQAFRTGKNGISPSISAFRTYRHACNDGVALSPLSNVEGDPSHAADLRYRPSCSGLSGWHW